MLAGHFCKESEAKSANSEIKNNELGETTDRIKRCAKVSRVSWIIIKWAPGKIYIAFNFEPPKEGPCTIMSESPINLASAIL